MEYSIQSSKEVCKSITYNQLDHLLKEFVRSIHFELRNADNFKIMAQLELDENDKNFVLSFNFQYYMSFFFITTKGNNLAEMTIRLLKIVNKTLEIHQNKKDCVII